MKKSCTSPMILTVLLVTLFLMHPVHTVVAQEVRAAPSTIPQVRSFTPTAQGRQEFEFFQKGRLEFEASSLSFDPSDSGATATTGALPNEGGAPAFRQPLQVQRVGFSPADFPTNQSFNARGPVYRFGPQGIRFQQPALLTLPYESELEDEALIEIYYYNRETRRWEVQPTVSRDTRNRTVTALIGHFSEYVAGSSSFTVDEAGTLDGGNRLGAWVDPYLGSLLIDSTEFDIPARGLSLSLGARFNSDYLYRKVLPDFIGSETTAGLTRVKPGNQVYAFPQTDIKSGWYYELPYCTFSTNTLDLVLENGRKHELSNCIAQWKSMTNGASRDYGAYRIFRPSSSVLRILIPEAELGVQVSLNTSGVVSQASVYFPDGSRAEFPASGAVRYRYDASGKNRLEYTFSGTTLQKVTHTDGRTVKILTYINGDDKECIVYLLSTSPDPGVLNEGDQFLGRRVFDANGELLLFSDFLQTHNFTPESTGFALNSANESTYFHVLQRTSYEYNLNSTVTDNTIEIFEPGGGYRKFVFGKSFGPQMVSHAQTVEYRIVGTGEDRGEESLTKSYSRYQNKPKVVRQLKSESKGLADGSVREFKYYCSHASEEAFTTASFNFNTYDTVFGGILGYTNWNTTPSRSTIVIKKSTEGAESYLTEEKLTFTHTGSSPEWSYCGIGQAETLKHTGQSTPSSTLFEKVVRTFILKYDGYYPASETVYRGGGTSAAWTITNTYDSYARLIKKHDTRSGNQCLYYLYGGLPGSAAFSYPYTAPTTRDLYTAFKVVGGTGNEVAANTYHKEYQQFDGNLNVVQRKRMELVPNGTGGYTTSASNTSYSYDLATNNLIALTLPNGDTVSISYGTGWKSSFATQDSRTLSTTPLKYLKTDFDYDIRGRLLSRRAYIADNTGIPIVDPRFPLSYREYTYDGLSRVLSVSRRNADDSTIKLRRTVYDDTNLSVLSTDARGYQSLTYYDTFFRPAGRYSYRPDTDTRNADYNGSGRAELSHSTYTYDPARISLLLSETTYLTPGEVDPLTIAYTYDTLGRGTKAQRTRSGTTITVSETAYIDLTNEVVTKSYRTGTVFTTVRVDKDWLDRPSI
jgi:hypothetical protein